MKVSIDSLLGPAIVICGILLVWWGGMDGIKLSLVKLFMSEKKKLAEYKDFVNFIDTCFVDAEFENRFTKELNGYRVFDIEDCELHCKMDDCVRHYRLLCPALGMKCFWSVAGDSNVFIDKYDDWYKLRSIAKKIRQNLSN